MPASRRGRGLADPISRHDLLGRVEALRIRASDLRRYDGSGLEASRQNLVSDLKGLAAWADRPENPGDAEVQRRLAQVAKEFGEFEQAADRYERLLDWNERRGTYELRRGASVEDLKDFANARGPRCAAASPARDHGGSAGESRDVTWNGLCWRRGRLSKSAPTRRTLGWQPAL